MPEFPIPSARILLVSQKSKGGDCPGPPCPPVRYTYARPRFITIYQGGSIPSNLLAIYYTRPRFIVRVVVTSQNIQYWQKYFNFAVSTKPNEHANDTNGLKTECIDEPVGRR